MKKFCTKCGKPFESIGREVICPDCKQAAAEESKKAAVMRAKRASWNGESVPVRISGRASTLIRKYGEANNMTFAESLDALLKNTPFFTSLGVEWSTIVPYKSHRRDKATSTPQDKQDKQGKQDKQDGTQATSKPQEAPQDVQGEPVKPVKMAAKKAAKATSKTSTSKTAGKATDASKKGERKA